MDERQAYGLDPPSRGRHIEDLEFLPGQIEVHDRMPETTMA